MTEPSDKSNRHQNHSGDDGDLRSPLSEAQIEMLVASANFEAADVNEQELARIRALSSQAFVEANESPADVAPPIASPSLVITEHAENSRWNHTMKTLSLVASTVLVLAVGWFVTSSNTEASLTLADVLEQSNQANFLHLMVQRNDQTADVWIKDARVVRWEDGSGEYQIARGSKLWEIDASGEEENVKRTARNPWRAETGKVDLLAFVEIPPNARKELLEARADGFDTFAGKTCMVFRELIQKDDQRLRLQIYVDPESHDLLGMTLREWGAKTKGPPIAEVSLMARNVPVDEDKFRVPVQLAESDRVGKVSDSQGLVSIRPIGSQRWTPVAGPILLQVGDWVRTDVRGANAATIKLVSDVELIIGPGSIVELTSPTEARLHTGSIQVDFSEQTPNPFLLRGLKDAELKFNEAGKTLVRLDQKEFVKVDNTPLWLSGYEGTTAENSIGSLIVEINEQAVPLTIGEHHVTVEIRDQIARTTIEETFVNHTNSRLEGQFHFPLPQDASISGFGMWIGGELIEADIVEKQRAREIYETILREKRDPGLLEWTGGNIFKARVFPIEAHSEKRVKIVYTQILPLQGSRYRYSYGLRSEMLQTNPLRELNIRCLISSTVPLSDVDSPTHTCRKTLTEHAAELEFVAQEYTPDSDFEVVCDVSSRENDVIAIPHRRGDDGYFLLELMPPGESGDWQRTTIDDGAPLELILLCDTSGSMDSTMRENQLDFVIALVGSLGPKDKVMAATTDVTTNWILDEFTAASDETLTTIRSALSDRVSLGWTDLDQAIESVLEKVTPQTQVIYIGDGIVATSESDPAAFVNRAKRQFTAKFDSESQQPDFHAVSVGSSYESVVLKGMASLGRGSMRQISGEKTPQLAAVELLKELTSPGLKNVNVEFRGIQVAAVYPETLPNIPVGTQQILVGRYLPTGENQRGEIIVTGTLDGEPVRYVAKIELENAEEGNSFIPRLWARAHLDQLLQQGSNQLIQDQIIALSEEFHIITPYTSLLVLESDADRERFGVKRRFGMRDGEQFFADGRSNANYELKQKQMQLAGNWRIGLRRQILSQLADLGRDASWFNTTLPTSKRENLVAINGRLGDKVYPVADLVQSMEFNLGAVQRSSGVRFGRGYEVENEWGAISTRDEAKLLLSRPQAGNSARGLDGVDLGFSNGVIDEYGVGLDGSQPMSWEFSEFQQKELSSNLWADGETDDFTLYDLDIDGIVPARRERGRVARQQAFEGLELFGEYGGYPGQQGQQDLYAGARIQFLDESRLTRGGSAAFAIPSLSKQLSGTSSRGLNRLQDHVQYFDEGRNSFRRRSNQASQQLGWVSALFPNFERSAKREKQSTEDHPWSPEAIELSKSLLRIEKLAELNGGLRITREQKSWSDDFDQLVTTGRRTEWWSPERWATLNHSQTENAIVNWRDEKTRGVYSQSLLLGQVTDLKEEMEEGLPLGLSDYSLTPLHESYRGYSAELKENDAARTVLLLTAKNSNSQLRFTINTEKNVVEKYEHLTDGEVNSTTEYREFQLVAGQWWATEIVTTRSASGDRVVYSVKQDVDELAANSFDAACEEATASKDQALLLKLPLPNVKSAKQAVRDDDASIEDHFVLVVYFSSYQLWEKVFEQIRALEILAEDKPGLRWIRVAIEKSAGRNEDARQRIVEFIDAWAAGNAKGIPPQGQGDLYLATHALSEVYSLIGWGPYSPLVESLKPVFEKQFEPESSLLNWNQRWLTVLDKTGRSDEALKLAQQMATDHPGNVNLQISYVDRLSSASRRDDGYAYLESQMKLQNHWEDYELTRLREHYANMLEGDSRYADLLIFLSDWMDVETASTSVFARYISALIMNDQVDEGEKTAREWLKIGQQDGELSAVDVAKTQAAIRFAFGQGHNLRRYYGMDRKWLPELYATARKCAQFDTRRNIVTSITNNGNFQQSDAGDRLRADLLGWLLEDTRDMPLQRLTWFIDLLRHGRLLTGEDDEMEIRQVTAKEWRTIADQILARWEEEQDPDQKHSLSSPLRTIYSSQLVDLHLPFLRRQIEDGPEKYELTYRQFLFDQLLAQTWTEELEQEAFTLWSTLTNSESKAEQTRSLAQRLYQLVDAMLRNRIAAASKQFQDEANFEEMTRTELVEKQAEFVKSAREGVRNRLVNAAAKLGDTHEQIIPWLNMERMWLDVQLGENRDNILKSCWSIVGDDIPEIDLEQEFTTEEAAAEAIQSLLRQRAFQMILNLTARKEATDLQIQKLFGYVDRAIEQSAENSKIVNAEIEEEEDPVDLSVPWKQLKYELLVLFDRPEELIELLQNWIKDEKQNIPWRRALALLHAERGEIEKAIELFEGIKKEDQLSAADEKTLADWYLVTDQRDDYDDSRFDKFEQMSENQLSNYLNQRTNLIRNGRIPREIDEEMLFALKALFKKASSTYRPYSVARDIYKLTRDFRALEQVPESIPGKTQSKIYESLSNFRSYILNEVRKEATADEMLETLRALRQRIKAGDVPRGADPNKRSLALDLRALDLVEAMIEWQSSQVLNQPGPHVDKAVAAIERAFEHDWQKGEQPRYALFLQQLGAITNNRNQNTLRKLASVQLSQLKTLYERAEVGSSERARIAQYRSTLLFNRYLRKQEALDLFKIALDEFAAANEGTIPFGQNHLVMTYSNFLKNVSFYSQAEDYVQKHLDVLTDDDQRWTYEEHLNQLYDSALRHNSRVSLGAGATLFENLVERMIDLTSTANDNRRHSLLNRIINLHDYAVDKNQERFAGSRQGFLDFANKRLPELLKPQKNYYSSVVSHCASRLADSVSSTEAVSFLLDRYEEYPQRLRYTSQDPWSQHGSSLASYRLNLRREMKPGERQRIQTLELRLLVIILEELRTDLVNRSSRNRVAYHDDYSYYWSEHAAEFARVAEDVLKDYHDSPRTITYVCEYLYNGLSRYQRAITVMSETHERGLLDDSGVRTLVGYMQNQRQYANSIPLLLPLIERFTSEMSLRVLLMRAYYHTKRFDELDRLIAKTDEHFHQQGRWQESNVIQFARICNETQRYERAVTYFEEAINLHQRTQPNRGIGNGTLSRYYREMSSAYLALGETEKAVDAAAGAVVSWGPTHSNRQEATENLKNVIANAKDLPKFIQSVDAKAEETGQDSPLIRKAIGLALLNRKDFRKAIQHLNLALELSPYDREIHTALLQAYDALKDSEGATKQLLAQIDFDRHNLALYKDLAQRNKENPKLSERAATSIVESAPNEAESHQALAEFRKEQGRLSESIQHWKRVAELRKLEPTGLLGLARTQIQAKQWNDARASIRQLQRKEWPEHFGNVENEIRELDRKVSERRL